MVFSILKNIISSNNFNALEGEGWIKNFSLKLYQLYCMKELKHSKGQGKQLLLKFDWISEVWPGGINSKAFCANSDIILSLAVGYR